MLLVENVGFKFPIPTKCLTFCIFFLVFYHSPAGLHSRGCWSGGDLGIQTLGKLIKELFHTVEIGSWVIMTFGACMERLLYVCILGRRVDCQVWHGSSEEHQEGLWEKS